MTSIRAIMEANTDSDDFAQQNTSVSFPHRVLPSNVFVDTYTNRNSNSHAVAEQTESATQIIPVTPPPQSQSPMSTPSLQRPFTYQSIQQNDQNDDSITLLANRQQRGRINTDVISNRNQQNNVLSNGRRDEVATTTPTNLYSSTSLSQPNLLSLSDPVMSSVLFSNISSDNNTNRAYHQFPYTESDNIRNWCDITANQNPQIANLLSSSESDILCKSKIANTPEGSEMLRENINPHIAQQHLNNQSGNSKTELHCDNVKVSRHNNSDMDQDNDDECLERIKRKLDMVFIMNHVRQMFGNKNEAYSEQLLEDFKELFQQDLSATQINKIFLLLKRQATSMCDAVNYVGSVISDVAKDKIFRSILGDRLVVQFAEYFDNFLATSVTDSFYVTDILTADDYKLREIAQALPSRWSEMFRFGAGLGFAIICKLIIEQVTKLINRNSQEGEEHQTKGISKNKIYKRFPDNVFPLPPASDYGSIDNSHSNMNSPLFHIPSNSNEQQQNSSLHMLLPKKLQTTGISAKRRQKSNQINYINESGGVKRKVKNDSYKDNNKMTTEYYGLSRGGARNSNTSSIYSVNTRCSVDTDGESRIIGSPTRQPLQVLKKKKKENNRRQASRSLTDNSEHSSPEAD